MQKDRCIHTNVDTVQGNKLEEYTGKGIPLCISDFIHGTVSQVPVRFKDDIKRLESFLDKIPIPVFYKNIEGIYSGCNRAFFDFIGCLDGEPPIKMENIQHLEGIIDRNCTNESKLLQQKGSRTCEAIIKTNDGDIKYALINKASLINDRGEIYGLLGIVSDITSQKLMKDAFNKTHIDMGLTREEHFQELSTLKKLLFDESNKRRKIEKELNKASRRLITFMKKYEENSAAMKVILTYQEAYKKEIEENMISNIKHLIMPYLLQLKRNKTVMADLKYINLIEAKIDEIISPLASHLSAKYRGLTPREIQIADLVKDGKQDKDIMEIMNISLDTVKTHRKNIRRKLGIYGDRTNLRSILLSLSTY